tara:strand:- start:204 stop:455 length:252 start_codon:yes stop_codon:yes gene_type:complete
MGRAIDMENTLDALGARLKLIEDALEEMIQTRVHHVDLHDEIDKHEERIREENAVEIEPDEKFTPPVRTRKKTTRKKAATTVD